MDLVMPMKNLGEGNKGEGHLGVVDKGSLLGEFAFVFLEKKKLVSLQKKNRAGAKKL